MLEQSGLAAQSISHQGMAGQLLVMAVQSTSRGEVPLLALVVL
jgi:hypothetical protein